MSNATNWIPERKVVAGAVSALVVWGLTAWLGDVPNEVTVALPALVGFAMAYLVPNKA